MNELLFTEEIVKRIPDKWSLRERFLLLFRPKNHSQEDRCRMTFKELDGKIYVLKFEYREL